MFVTAAAWGCPGMKAAPSTDDLSSWTLQYLDVDSRMQRLHVEVLFSI